MVVYKLVCLMRKVRVAFGLLCLFPVVQVSATVTDAAFFKNFINGGVPIKEAFVYRKLSKPDGTLINEDWWRLGYQSGSWYVLRLIPNPQNAGKFLQFSGNIICGASLNQLWTVSDDNVHLVGKNCADGSVVDEFGLLNRGVLFGALSLGIPRMLNKFAIDDALVEWEDSSFTSTVVNKLDDHGRAIATRQITGKLTLGENGLPISAEFPDLDQFDGGFVTYEYAKSNSQIPTAFNIKYKDCQFRFEFLSLVLGANNLKDGYVPESFADMKFFRTLTVWTNSTSYPVDGGYLGSALKRPVKWKGIFIFTTLAFMSACFVIVFCLKQIKSDVPKTMP